LGKAYTYLSMGLCASQPTLTVEEKEAIKNERNRSAVVEKQVRLDRQQDSDVNKLLLLGAGESGKSTLFKQMISIYGTGYPEAERATFRSVICNNVMVSAQALIAAAPHFGGPVRCTTALQFFKPQMPADLLITRTNDQHFKDLWKDPGIQRAYENRAQFQLIDSTKYFFDKLDEIAVDTYIPSQQDVLRSRVRTLGIVESSFNIDGNTFRMFDVGGQRNERKKWIHCFEHVTAVLFVGVLSEYDLVLFEDPTMSRMVETITLFEDICNSQWFTKTSMILFLNKRDIFEDKITKVPLNVCPLFMDYKGPNTYAAGCEAIDELFKSKNRNAEKVIYTHVTCATDTSNITAVFHAVKDIIIRMSLGEAGLV